MTFVRKAFGIAAVAAATFLGFVAGSDGVASALPNPYAPVPVNPNDYLAGNTVYFSVGSDNCAIHPNGDVGCDFATSQTLDGFIFPIPVNDVAIDVAFLPAHPEFGLRGAHGRVGSRALDMDSAGHWQAGSISYAGTTCQVGFHGAWGCSSKGHAFSSWSGRVSVS